MSDARGDESGSVDPAAGMTDLDRRRRALNTSLVSAQRRSAPPQAAVGRGNALGVAFRIATELVAGVVVGGGIGWLLDRWIGTRPFLFLLFLGLGVAAGMINVFRSAYRMNRPQSGEAADEGSGGADTRHD